MVKYYHFSWTFGTKTKWFLWVTREHTFSDIVTAENPEEAESKLHDRLQAEVPDLPIIPGSIISEHMSLIEEIVNIQAPVSITLMK